MLTNSVLTRLFVHYRSTLFCKCHILEIHYSKWIFIVSLNLIKYFWTSPHNSQLYPALSKIHLNFRARIGLRSIEIYMFLCLLESIQICTFRITLKFPQPLNQHRILWVQFEAAVVSQIMSWNFWAAVWGFRHWTLPQISCLQTSLLLLSPQNRDLNSLNKYPLALIVSFYHVLNVMPWNSNSVINSQNNQNLLWWELKFNFQNLSHSMSLKTVILR